MNKLKSFFSTLMKDESGQGTAEYVLMLVIVVSLVVMFKSKIVAAISSKMGDVTDGMGQISTGQ